MLLTPLLNEIPPDMSDVCINPEFLRHAQERVAASMQFPGFQCESKLQKL
jgi:hypothetical protein